MNIKLIEHQSLKSSSEIQIHGQNFKVHIRPTKDDGSFC